MQPFQVLCSTQCSHASITTSRLKTSYPTYYLTLLSATLYNIILDTAYNKALCLSKYKNLLIVNRLDVQ